MENFLLLLDELDDAVISLVMVLPQILSFVGALSLMILTGLALIHWPILMSIALASSIGLVSLALRQPAVASIRKR